MINLDLSTTPFTLVISIFLNIIFKSSYCSSIREKPMYDRYVVFNVNTEFFAQFVETCKRA